MRKRSIFIYLLLVFFSASVIIGQSAAADATEKTGLIYWIPLNQTVEQGLTAYLERTFNEAEEAGADALVVEMDTLGGEVRAALAIGKLFSHTAIPVTVFIKGEAISAGAYIALNAETIVMTPTSAIGAAEPRLITGETADPKSVAMWSSTMRAAAEAHGRDPDIAQAMVDRNVEIEGLTEKGELVSLSAKQAVEHGMADAVVENQQDVLDVIGYPEAHVEEISMTPAEKVARFITSPFVVPILFLIGLIGIAIELFTPGFGIPGIVGVLAFALYFFGHFVAGFAGLESILLFVAGVTLLLIELFIPGFGIFGFLGLMSLMAGIVMAAYDVMFGLGALLIAIVVTVVILVFAVRYFKIKGAWRKFVLTDKQEKQSGYVAPRTYDDLEGKHGTTMTPLRPAGAMLLEGKRYDVVSEGGFIPANQSVVVLQVEGPRIVVRQTDGPAGPDKK